MLKIIPVLALGILLLCPPYPVWATSENASHEDIVNEYREETQSAKRIGIQEAFEIYKSGKAILISVDGANYYKSRRILGSVNIPLSTLEKINLPYPKDQTILLFCR